MLLTSTRKLYVNDFKLTSAIVLAMQKLRARRVHLVALLGNSSNSSPGTFESLLSCSKMKNSIKFSDAIEIPFVFAEHHRENSKRGS